MDAVKKELTWFGTRISIKGIGRIVQSESLIIKVWWTTTTVIFLSVALYQTIGQILAFYTYPTIVESELKEFGVNDSYFPSVMLCNAIPISSNPNLPNGKMSLAQYYDHVTSVMSCKDCIATTKLQLEQTRMNLLRIVNGIDMLTLPCTDIITVTLVVNPSFFN